MQVPDLFLCCVDARTHDWRSTRVIQETTAAFVEGLGDQWLGADVVSLPGAGGPMFCDEPTLAFPDAARIAVVWAARIMSDMHTGERVFVCGHRGGGEGNCGAEGGADSERLTTLHHVLQSAKRAEAMIRAADPIAMPTVYCQVWHVEDGLVVRVDIYSQSALADYIGVLEEAS
jgi:hypothetical protein